MTEPEILHRSYEAVELHVEGRTVDVRIVPFDEVARVADPPDYTPYEEQWMPGCFDHQLKAANRVHANYEHQPGLSGVVGHGLALRREADGYHGSFEIHPTPDGEKALHMIKGGALPGVSLEARPVRNVVTAGGIVQRVKAHLRGMAFCREGAFAGAQVLAVRTAQTLDADLFPVDIDPELVERLRTQGIRLPDRYQAHPETPGTPAETGTPEDGTRHANDPSSSEETTSHGEPH
jgi:HK97 family phage prohead protease